MAVLVAEHFRNQYVYKERAKELGISLNLAYVVKVVAKVYNYILITQFKIFAENEFTLNLLIKVLSYCFVLYHTVFNKIKS